MVYLDTNTLIRFFLREEQKKVDLIKSLFEKESEICVIDAVLPEIEYVLTSVYQQSRDVVVDSFQFLSSHSSIILSYEARQAIRLFEISRLDMVDCLLAVSSLRSTLASFDKKLLNTPGVTPYWE